MRTKEINRIVNLHEMWVKENPNGVWKEGISSGEIAYFKNENLRKANLRNRDLRYANFNNADLSYADLRGADLRDATLVGANLNYAKLNDANLEFADVRYASLIGAKLNGANLNGTHLKFANMKDTRLVDADLRAADLSDADLSGANLKNTKLDYIKMCGTNFSGVKGILSPIDYLKKNFKKTKAGYIAYMTFDDKNNFPKEWILEPNRVITENVNYDHADDKGCGVNVAPLKYIKENCHNDIWKVLIKWEWLVGVCIPYNTDGVIRCERVQLLEILENSD